MSTYKAQCTTLNLIAVVVWWKCVGTVASLDPKTAEKSARMGNQTQHALRRDATGPGIVCVSKLKQWQQKAEA